MKSIAIAAMLVLAPAFANAEDIKKLTSADLSVETHKWDGKTIEASFSCFFMPTKTNFAVSASAAATFGPTFPHLHL